MIHGWLETILIGTLFDILPSERRLGKTAWRPTHSLFFCLMTSHSADGRSLLFAGFCVKRSTAFYFSPLLLWSEQGWFDAVRRQLWHQNNKFFLRQGSLLPLKSRHIRIDKYLCFAQCAGMLLLDVQCVLCRQSATTLTLFLLNSPSLFSPSFYGT